MTGMQAENLPANILARRASGVLLHPTALPGPHGIGALGEEARKFVDFLVEAGQSLWQVLPLGPTGFGDSPYTTLSAFAGNPLLIDLSTLVEWGDLEPGDLAGGQGNEGNVDFPAVRQFKEERLAFAAQRFATSSAPARRADFERFCREQAAWLPDYALFTALRGHFQGQSWQQWPLPLRDREAAALAEWRDRLAPAVAGEAYRQYAFFTQWRALKGYANQRGVSLFGDLPIFVALDSADVWANRQLFRLDADGQPTVVAGVPPDYFSATGQRWGNPLYRWEAHRQEHFAWWLARFRGELERADLVRIDHFRGFEACWVIPAGEETAVKGTWEKAPGDELFQALHAARTDLPIVAEDLGVITPEVEALRRKFGFPGMKILQFAFDSGAGNPYLPHNFSGDCVFYTGTHDNATTLGWWQSLDAAGHSRVATYLGKERPEPCWDLIRLALGSVAQLCVIPCQDLLGLGDGARFNSPGEAVGNWRWRLPPGALDKGLAGRLHALTELFNRAPKPMTAPCREK